MATAYRIRLIPTPTTTALVMARTQAPSLMIRKQGTTLMPLMPQFAPDSEVSAVFLTRSLFY